MDGLDLGPLGLGEGGERDVELREDRRCQRCLSSVQVLSTTCLHETLGALHKNLGA